LSGLEGVRSRVVVLGSMNMDLVVQVDQIPAPGETVLGRRFFSAGGGKGANQAVAAARLGARVSMVGCVGSDLYGRELLRLVRADGVDVRHVERVPGASGVAVIVVAEGGQNQIAVAPGANWMVTPEMVSGAALAIRRADLLVAQLEVPLEAVVAAARLAREAGVPFLLNAAPARADLGPLLEMVTLLVVNETELAVVSGRPVREGEEAAAAEAMLDRGPEAVLVTLGERGALVADRRGVHMAPAFRVKAVDTTAAGDAFVGALAAAFRGLERLRETVVYACAAGALACTRAGAQPSLPSSDEVRRFLENAQVL